MRRQQSMDLHKIFFNEFGRLRSGWRLLLYVFAFIAASFLLVSILRVVLFAARAAVPSFPYADFIAEIAFRSGTLAAALIAGYLCVRIFEGLPWRSLGLTLHRGWVRDLIFGSAIGIGALALAVAIAAVAGGLRFSFAGSDMLPAVGKSLVSSAVLLLVAALAEEAAFRGYPLQTLTRAQLTLFGVLLTSLPFGFVHLTNPNVVPGVTFANTAFAGVWLAAAYLRTRSLWFPLGVHWGWNWALGWIFGLPISGLRIVSHPILIGEDAGPAWLTGGRYGIEGGVACSIALVVSTLFIWRTGLVSATPELKKLTSEENPATPRSVSVLS
ncbi:MAG TPA: CPBP family intramembrane glutamic endopeptidase [Pyrinomonadaceae bacterium]|nr:CPBP family intramembrane glutamic endopeptidase [Pyrinomonadaceae bacterium]